MTSANLAVLGTKPQFDKALPVGQLYFPSWERYEEAFKGIFDRKYYTNQGPLAQLLEEKIADFLGVNHVVCVTNATIGLMMLPDALGLSGKVILPSFTFAASAQSLTWAQIEPVFCDIDIDTHQIATEQIDRLMDDDVSAIMGVNLWGGVCDQEKLAEIAKANGIQLYFDSAHAFGCAVEGKKVGNFGMAEVFSFHATKVLNATEGGCICTNNSELASRLRNIRSSYGVDKFVNVTKTANGRMSEAQAAIALLSLEDFSANQKNNANLYQLYEERLRAIPGLNLVKPTGVSFSNYQYLVCCVNESEFGLPRDLLIEVLKAENIIARRYFYPGLHRTIPYINEVEHDPNRFTNTDSVCTSCIQLPLGALVTPEDVERISDIIIRAHQNSEKIRWYHEK